MGRHAGRVAPDHGDVARLARGGALNLAGAVAYAVLNLALLAVLTRGLGAGGAGGFIEAIAIFNVLSVVSLLGVDTGLVRTVSQFRVVGRRREIVRTIALAIGPMLFIGSLAAVAVVAFAPQLAEVFGDGGHERDIAGYLRAMAAFIPLAALSLALLATTRGYGTMLPTVAVERIGKPVLQTVGCLVVIVAGFGATQLAIAWASPIGLALALSLLWYLRLRHHDSAAAPTATTPPRPWRALAREFWAFTLPRSLASVFRVVIQWLDVLLVGGLLSTRAAAVYAVSSRIMQFGYFVQTASTQVAQPLLAAAIAGTERHRMTTIFRTTTGWTMVLGWPQYLALISFAPVMLRLFGPGFDSGVAVVMILAAAGLFATGVGPVDMTLLMSGRSALNFWNTVISLTTNVALNIVLIPRIGITGAAVAWAVSRTLDNLLPLVQVALSLRIHPFGREFAYAAAASLACFGVTGVAFRALAGATLGAFLVYAGLSCAAYAGVLFVVRRRLHLPDAMVALDPRRRRAAGSATMASATAEVVIDERPAVTPRTSGD